MKEYSLGILMLLFYFKDDAIVNMPEELDIVVINLHGDMYAAEQYLTHLNQLCEIKIFILNYCITL